MKTTRKNEDYLNVEMTIFNGLELGYVLEKVLEGRDKLTYEDRRILKELKDNIDSIVL